ncbi:MAG: ATP-binding protein [Cytophagales bacterium]|nr:ATP-binding protein [Cytophagales bacterium]
MDFFVNREEEQQEFLHHLNRLCSKSETAPILLFHGPGGMGKTWLLQRFKIHAEQHDKKPFIIYIDCNKTDMTIERLFNEILTALEYDFLDYFDEYVKFLDKVENIEKIVDEEVIKDPKNAEQFNNIIASVASKAVASTVPGAAFVGEKAIGDAMKFAVGGIHDGITSFRRKLARKKLDRDKYTLFLKDLQEEQAKELARILNKICKDKKRKIILLVDRFEKLVNTPNTRSDKTFYEYWRDVFLNQISNDIFVIQASRTDYSFDYQNFLFDRQIKSFELKKFREKDIIKILPQVEELQKKMHKYEEFIKVLFELTEGYPVAVGFFRSSFTEVTSSQQLEKLKNEVLEKKVSIIQKSINWFLDNNADPKYRDTIYKLAICCSRSGKIDKAALKYIFNKSEMNFSEVEDQIKRLAQQYSFIDAINDTMHELAREFILKYLKIKDEEYLKQINVDLEKFYAG